ncbi:MAG: Hpt domain-containing protein [Candidatus Omnitrophica bacterium]|nr:Hpt domain-containing protein [Candidatus Omnitrophota bacterium]
MGEFQYDVNKVCEELHVRAEILEKLLKSFTGTLAQKIAELDELVPQRNIDKIRAIMHEVKGTAGNLRLNEVYCTADTMHLAVKAEEPQEKIIELFDAFKKESELFFNHMEQK